MTILPHLTHILRSWLPPTPITTPSIPTALVFPATLVRPSLSQLAQMDQQALPQLIQESAAAIKYIELLGVLDWEHFPAPDAPIVAAFLVKLDKGLASMSKLGDELVEQPALTWVLGFPLVPSDQFSWGFDVDASLPTHRHMSRLLRKLPNAQMQFLLKGTVHLLNTELPGELNFGDEVSLDTVRLRLRRAQSSRSRRSQTHYCLGQTE